MRLSILVPWILMACQKPPTPPQIQTKVFAEKIAQQSIADLVEFPAQVLADRQVDVAAEIGGIVGPLHFVVGDSMAKGQLLLEIRNPDPMAGFQSFKLRTPFPGEISRAYVQAGDTVIAGQKILQLVDPNSLRFFFHSNPEDLRFIQRGMEGTWSSLDGSQKYPVHVTALSRVLDEKTGTAPGELRLKSGTDNPSLFSGLLGRVSFRKHPRKAWLVSENAIFYKQRVPHVVVLDEQQRARYQPVSIVARHDSKLEITGTLSEGSTIVSRSSGFIVEGEKLVLAEGGAS